LGQNITEIGIGESWNQMPARDTNVSVSERCKCFVFPAFHTWPWDFAFAIAFVSLFLRPLSGA